MKNQVLISNGKNLSANEIIGGDFKSIDEMRRHAINLTGNDRLPPVLYKGNYIPAGRLGEREFSK